MIETREWVKTVKGWYQGYSEQEKLLVLETQERMIKFIEELLTTHQADLIKQVEGIYKEKYSHFTRNYSEVDQFRDDVIKLLEEK